MIKITTPKGIAGRLILVRPDTKFDAQGTYKVDIALKAAEAGDLLKACREEAFNELGARIAAKASMPFEENRDGTITFKFRSRSKPNLYDSADNLLDAWTIEASRIGPGSTIRVKGEAAAYEGFGGGVTLYLLEVQIIHLVKCKNSGFEADPEGSFIVPNGRIGLR
ncbi:hypothetical protein ACT2E5_07195 [Burkholderia vietnamiensis]|uniref:hypothetical protein n=1 Tax=Burkholderia vietnamiensis TaxID=60552 RepID=UPI00402A973E